MAAIKPTLLTLVFVLFTSQVTNGILCPNFFEPLNDRCYFFSQSIGMSMTWEDARSYCQTYSDSTTDYDLLTLDTNFDEFTVVRDFMQMKGYSYYTYIGAYDLGLNENLWTWVDGSPLPLNFPLWDCDHPYSYSSSNDCLVFLFALENTGEDSTTSRLKIIDHSCHYHRNFICEGTPGTLMDNKLQISPKN